MTGTIAPLLPVTPEDRMAAWPFVPSNSIAGTNREGFFAGGYDSAAIVQAFARHRISHSLPGEGIFDIAPSIVTTSPEPSLREIVNGYYGAHFPADKADKLTAEYFAALTPSPCPGDVGTSHRCRLCEGKGGVTEEQGYGVYVGLECPVCGGHGFSQDSVDELWAAMMDVVGPDTDTRDLAKAALLWFARAALSPSATKCQNCDGEGITRENRAALATEAE